MDPGDQIAENLKDSINNAQLDLDFQATREHLVERDIGNTQNLQVAVVDGGVVTTPASRGTWNEFYTSRLVVQKNLSEVEDRDEQVDQLKELVQQIVQHLRKNRAAPVIAAITAIERPTNLNKEKLHKDGFFESVTNIESRLEVVTS